MQKQYISKISSHVSFWSCKSSSAGAVCFYSSCRSRSIPLSGIGNVLLGLTTHLRPDLKHFSLPHQGGYAGHQRFLGPPLSLPCLPNLPYPFLEWGEKESWLFSGEKVSVVFVVFLGPAWFPNIGGEIDCTGSLTVEISRGGRVILAKTFDALDWG
jgi:hypothetical protein